VSAVAFVITDQNYGINIDGCSCPAEDRHSSRFSGLLGASLQHDDAENNR
jgi:hypothetical protein